MPKIITSTIRTTKPRRKPRPTNELAAYQRHEARKARAERQHTIRSDGVTRCSKCPPLSCCPTCARINNARQIAGLISPRGDPAPHPNNCLPCIPHTPHYQGSKPLKIDPKHYEVVSLDITPLGAGWFRSAALLGGDEIYVKKVRTRAAAEEFARTSMLCIRQGLAFERELNQ
jgi:hypothetical protein